VYSRVFDSFGCRRWLSEWWMGLVYSIINIGDVKPPPTEDSRAASVPLSVWSVWSVLLCKEFQTHSLLFSDKLTLRSIRFVLLTSSHRIQAGSLGFESPRGISFPRLPLLFPDQVTCSFILLVHQVLCHLSSVNLTFQFGIFLRPIIHGVLSLSRRSLKSQ
jgi:hypothetical protein